MSTVSKKNAEISDLSYKYEKELSDLEFKLNSVKLDKDGLKSELVDEYKIKIQ